MSYSLFLQTGFYKKRVKQQITELELEGTLENTEVNIILTGWKLKIPSEVK